MCGGVRFQYQPVYDSALAEAYSEEKLAQFRETGMVEAVFWQAKPILPIQHGETIAIVQWGNRDKQLRLPLTGWVREERLRAGKWNYLRPQSITIPVQAGVERKIWFPIDYGIAGILIKQHDLTVAYMLTCEPTEQFAALTGHDRMPVLINQHM
jgi:hypothetical protein